MALCFVIVLVFIEVHGEKTPFRVHFRCRYAGGAEKYAVEYIMIVLYNKVKVFCKKNRRKRIKMQYRKLLITPCSCGWQSGVNGTKEYEWFLKGAVP